MKPGIKIRLVFLLSLLCVSQTYCRVINSALTSKRQSEESNATTSPTKATSATLTQRNSSSAAGKENIVLTTPASSLSVTPAVINKSSPKAARTTPLKFQPVLKVSPPPSRSTISIKYETRTASVSANVLNSSLPVTIKPNNTDSPSVSSKSSSKSSSSASVSGSNSAGASVSSNSSNKASVSGTNVSKQTESKSAILAAAITSVVSTLSTTEVTTEAATEITEPMVTEAIEIEETEPPTAFAITEGPEFEETEPPTIAETQVTEIPEVEETEPPTPGEGGAGVSEGQAQTTANAGEPGISIKAEAQQAIADQNAKGNVKVRSANSPVSGQESEAVEIEEPEATG